MIQRKKKKKKKACTDVKGKNVRHTKRRKRKKNKEDKRPCGRSIITFYQIVNFFTLLFLLKIG